MCTRSSTPAQIFPGALMSALPPQLTTLHAGRRFIAACTQLAAHASSRFLFSSCCTPKTRRGTQRKFLDALLSALPPELTTLHAGRRSIAACTQLAAHASSRFLFSCCCATNAQGHAAQVPGCAAVKQGRQLRHAVLNTAPSCQGLTCCCVGAALQYAQGHAAQVP
jgi:hypothetical protein